MTDDNRDLFLESDHFVVLLKNVENATTRGECLRLFSTLSLLFIFSSYNFCKATVNDVRDLFEVAREESARLRDHSACENEIINCTLSAWIETDFEPWQQSGITERMIERGLDLGGETNRFVIKDQKLYMTERKSKSKWGDSKRWYFALGLLELIEKFGREVPDVDIVINGEDYPISSKFETYVTGKVMNKNKSKKRAISRRK